MLKRRQLKGLLYWAGSIDGRLTNAQAGGQRKLIFVEDAAPGMRVTSCMSFARSVQGLHLRLSTTRANSPDVVFTVSPQRAGSDLDRFVISPPPGSRHR